MKLMGNNKISLTNVMIIYLCAVYTSFIRFVIGGSVIVAQQAAWLSIVASLIVFAPLVYILNRLLRAFEGQPLYSIMQRVFGRAVAAIVGTLLSVWLFILLSMYIKYSGETLVTTVYVGTDIRLLLFVMVALTAVMLRAGLPVFSRMNTVIFAVSVAQFLLIITLLFIDFNPNNVTPITASDAVPIGQSTVYPLTIEVYIVFILIFNDQIRLPKKSGLRFFLTFAFQTVAIGLLTAAVLGIFGASLTSKLKFPVHSAVENISILGGNTGVESLFISFWVILEFVLITLMAYLVVRMLRAIFGLKRDVPLLTAVMGFAYFFSIYFCADVFQLILFSQYVEPWFNIGFGFGIPVALFFTAKARKLLPPAPMRARKPKRTQPVPQPDTGGTAL